jgi:hypothetical protein
VRFGEDTSQTVYVPLSTTSFGLWEHGLGMDGAGRVHLVTGCDTAHTAYMLLDSSMQQIIDWRTISHTEDCHTAIQVDTAGNSLVVCALGSGLNWCYRQADGTWPYPPHEISDNVGANYITIVSMENGRFAFTCHMMVGGTGQLSQLHLLTFNLPPDTTALTPPAADHLVPRSEAIVASPNPFNHDLQLEVPGVGIRHLAIYDLLGREVWTQEVPDNVRNLSVCDPLLGQLPSGIYFVALKGNKLVSPIRILHTK